MRQIFPQQLEAVDPRELYCLERLGHHDRPWVLANMVASLDGSASSQGRSGGLSSPADRQVFHLLRELVDVILVGAGTARVENYGPAKGANPAAIAVVSRNLALDWASPFFVDAKTRPFVITCGDSSERLPPEASELANVIVAGIDKVDLGQALKELSLSGVNVVLCEGGPTLLGQLLEHNLLDELCLTLSPQIVGGDNPRITTNMASSHHGAELVSVLEEDGFLFLRYALTSADSTVV